MNSKQLSPRLQKVADYVVKYAPHPIRLADIGSDHAYLPCHLALNHQIEYAVAGEVVDGPYQAAISEVTQQQLDTIVRVRKGNGLEVVNSDDGINVVTICGMGGALIRDILEAGKHALSEHTKLVLQPNVGEHLVREWLDAHQYTIVTEAIICDHSRLYDVIVAQLHPKKITSLTEKELLFGPHHLANKSNEFYKKWERELNSTKQILHNIQRANYQNQDKVLFFDKKIKWIEEELERSETE